MIKNTILCIVVILSTLFINTNAAGARQPKFFFVSSTTSTTTAITTLASSVTVTCLELTKFGYPACRKRKSLYINEKIEITASNSNRKNIDIEPSGVSTVKEPQGNRMGRFAWYYMTTTLTTISTSTTYSLTTVSIVTVKLGNAAPACTPSSFLACGSGK